MSYIALVLSTSLIWFAAVVSPGPNFVVVSRLALAHSRLAAFGATLGIASGAALYAMLTMFGLNIIIAEFAWLATTVRIAGGLYLVYLGVQAWRHAGKTDIPDDLNPPTAGGFLAGLRVGLITALTNPKGIAFFVGLFAAAIGPETPVWAKLAMLASGVTIEIGWYGTVATALSTGPLRAGYRRVRRTLDRAFGALFVAFGLRLALPDR